MPEEPQNLMLSKAPHPNLAPSLCLGDHHLCPFSGLKHIHMSEKTGGPSLVGLGPAAVLTSASVRLSLDPHVLRPEPRSLSEKVSHLESLLRKLQEDLQKVTGWLGFVGESPAAAGKGSSLLTPAASPQPPGEGRQSSPGGGGSQPA